MGQQLFEHRFIEFQKKKEMPIHKLKLTAQWVKIKMEIIPIR